jgi:hypothetical protein
MSGVIITWQKSGCRAAFAEEWRKPRPESALTAAFAGSMGRPTWALWPWWPSLAREKGCVRVMDYQGMAALDRAQGVEWAENKLFFRGEALERLIDSELSAIDRIERRDAPRAEWLIEAAKHPRGVLVENKLEAARLGQTKEYVEVTLGAYPEHRWIGAAADVARTTSANQYPCPEDATLLFLARAGYRIERIALEDPDRQEGEMRIVPTEARPIDWVSEARAYWVGIRHDLEQARERAQRHPLTPARLDQLIDEERAAQAARREKMERIMASYEAQIRSKRLDALLVGLAAVLLEAEGEESASRHVQMRSIALVQEARAIYERSLEAGWMEAGLGHRWIP